MIDSSEIIETIRMIESENLDIRTITMGISLRDCSDPDGDSARRKIYDKITSHAENLVKVGDDIALEFGVPIINKRISVTPISIVAEPSEEGDYVAYAQTLDEAAKAVGVNFIHSLFTQCPGNRTERGRGTSPEVESWYNLAFCQQCHLFF